MKIIFPLVGLILVGTLLCFANGAGMELNLPGLATVSLEIRRDTAGGDSETEQNAETQPAVEIDNPATVEPENKAKPTKVDEKKITPPTSAPANSKPTVQETKNTTPPSPTAATTPIKRQQPKPDQGQGDKDGIWDGSEKPDQDEFGLEYDFSPDQLGEDTCLLNKFLPKLELPEPLTRDMFYKPQHQDAQQAAEKVQDWFKNTIAKVKNFFTPEKLKEQIDSIPGTIRSMVDSFQQKKAQTIMMARQKLDQATNRAGQEIADKLSGKKACLENSTRCLEHAKEAFQDYEKNLQEAVAPCMDKISRVIDSHQERITKARNEANETLSDMQDCMAQLEVSNAKAFVTSLLNIGSCTKKNMEHKLSQSMKPMMEKLNKMVQDQSHRMEARMKQASGCVHKQMHTPELEKLKKALTDQSEECLSKQS